VAAGPDRPADDGAQPLVQRDRTGVGRDQGSLDLPADVVERVTSPTTQVPVVLDVHLARAARPTRSTRWCGGLVAGVGASDAALLDALTGRILPRGRLPTELPRSLEAVRASRPDVPSDTADPLHPYGAGLGW
jgi:beta-glucosidase